jgi:hypothetical protein
MPGVQGQVPAPAKWPIGAGLFLFLQGSKEKPTLQFN